MPLADDPHFIEKLKKDLDCYQNFDIILYGSAIHGGERPNSDIDIVILSHNHDPQFNQHFWWDHLGKTDSKYDIRIFELLPLHIQNSIIKKYLVIYGNEIDIAEYFYLFRKRWDDMKYRYLELV